MGFCAIVSMPNRIRWHRNKPESMAFAGIYHECLCKRRVEVVGWKRSKAVIAKEIKLKAIILNKLHWLGYFLEGCESAFTLYQHSTNSLHLNTFIWKLMKLITVSQSASLVFVLTSDDLIHQEIVSNRRIGQHQHDKPTNFKRTCQFTILSILLVLGWLHLNTQNGEIESVRTRKPFVCLAALLR